MPDRLEVVFLLQKRGDINALYNAGVLAQAGLGLNPPREDYLRAFGYDCLLTTSNF